MLVEFNIEAVGEISDEFLARHIYTFSQAIKFVKELKYGRNKNKLNLTQVFYDNCGTCSTKHALLKQLALEHKIDDLKLYLGIFKMNATNTPKIAQTLKKYQLNYIPEAHNYLKWQNKVLDFTNKSSHQNDFLNDLIEEQEILPQQITDFKVAYHQKFSPLAQKTTWFKLLYFSAMGNKRAVYS